MPEMPLLGSLPMDLSYSRSKWIKITHNNKTKRVDRNVLSSGHEKYTQLRKLVVQRFNIDRLLTLRTKSGNPIVNCSSLEELFDWCKE